jgi:pimeloyl-ACP methyl ester carboxylesterase
MRRRRAAVLGSSVVAAGALAWAGWAVERSAAARLRADEAELIEAGLSMPSDAEHHFVSTSDGGRIHVVEHGSGPPVVLVHGVTLSSAIWAPMVRMLATSNRVLAIDLRGHGASTAGSDGMAFERQADDLLEVLEALDVEGAVLVGHSMGGMISQVLLGRRDGFLPISSFVALSTTTGPLSTSRAGRRMAGSVTALARRTLHRRIHHGSSIFPGEDAATWLTRMSFGADPGAPAVELARSQTQALSPTILADLLVPLLSFDGVADCRRITVPTTVVVGARDLLTPPRLARKLAAVIEEAELVRLGSVGHMIMLEDPEALADLIEAAGHGRP